VNGLSQSTAKFQAVSIAPRAIARVNAAVR
jgi:hypothetical protein